MADTIECPICCFEWKEKNIITCFKCQNFFCTDCCKTYILGNVREASCMNPGCEVKWSFRYMLTNFPEKWVNGPLSLKKKQNYKTYKEHIKDVYLDSEKSKLPETIDIAQRYKNVPEIQKSIDILKDNLSYYENEIRKIEKNIPHEELRILKITKKITTSDRKKAENNEEKSRLYKIIRESNERIKVIQLEKRKSREIIGNLKHKKFLFEEDLRKLYRQFNDFSNLNYHINDIVETEETEEIKKFLFPCPMEECRGLVESKTFKCGICSSQMCRKCRIYRGNNNENEDENECDEKKKHVCNEDDLKSVELLKNDTKACPKCATPIYKIDGCDQMFCPTCKVGFSWKTGLIEKGKMHNPHWYEWMREHGGGLQRDPEDVQCGGIPGLYYLYSARLMRINGNCANMERANYVVNEKIYTLFRVKYLIGEIEEKEWKQSLYKRRRHDDKGKINEEIIRLLGTMAGDLFRRLDQKYKNCKKCKNVRECCCNNNIKRGREDRYIEKFEKLRKFGNNLILKEMGLFGFLKPSLLDEDWHIIRFNNVINKDVNGIKIRGNKNLQLK